MLATVKFGATECESADASFQKPTDMLKNDHLELILEGFKSVSSHYVSIKRLFMFSIHSNPPKSHRPPLSQCSKFIN